MAQSEFTWRYDNFDFWVKVGDNEEFILEEIAVVTSKFWHTTVEFHHDTGLFEEDPREYSEADRETMRSLLRNLGYKKAERWSWKR